MARSPHRLGFVLKKTPSFWIPSECQVLPPSSGPFAKNGTIPPPSLQMPGGLAGCSPWATYSIPLTQGKMTPVQQDTQLPRFTPIPRAFSSWQPRGACAGLKAGKGDGKPDTGGSRLNPGHMPGPRLGRPIREKCPSKMCVPSPGNHFASLLGNSRMSKVTVPALFTRYPRNKDVPLKLRLGDPGGRR